MLYVNPNAVLGRKQKQKPSMSLAWLGGLGMQEEKLFLTQGGLSRFIPWACRTLDKYIPP